MNFKIILQSCYPRGGNVPFEQFFRVGWRSRSQRSNKCLNGHILSLSGPELVHLCMDFKIILHSCCPRGEKCHLKHFLFRFGFFVKKCSYPSPIPTPPPPNFFILIKFGFIVKDHLLQPPAPNHPPSFFLFLDF